MAKLNDTVINGWELKEGEDFNAYYKRQDKLYAELAEVANKATPTNPIGAIIKFGACDGYALYRVDSVKPLTLSHIPYGDAYEIPYAHIRGLTLTDIKEMVKSEIALKKIFSKK